MFIVVPIIKNVISKVYNWFNKKEMVTPDKLEVVSTTYFVKDVPDGQQSDGQQPDGSQGIKKKLTRMRVIKRTKGVKNEL